MRSPPGAAPFRPALCIAICTRDRPELTCRLISELVRLIERACDNADRITIYVSDNSLDETAFDRIRAVADLYPVVHARRASASFPSAEEHLRDLLTVVPGPYVWPLADDDLPRADAFANIFALLDQERPEIILINPPIVAYGSGAVLHSRFAEASWLPTDGSDLITDWIGVIQRVGLIHLSCLFSALIFDRTVIEDATWDKYLNISPIYSHSFVLLETFAKRKAILTTRDIFVYRLGAAETNNAPIFESLSKKLNVSDVSFWSTSLIAGMEACVGAGAVTFDQLNEIREVHWTSGTFSLLRFIFDRIATKLLSDARATSAVSPLSAVEMAAVRRFTRRVPDGLLGAFSHLPKLFDVVYPFCLMNNKSIDQEVDKLAGEFKLLYPGEQNALRLIYEAAVASRVEAARADARDAFVAFERRPPGQDRPASEPLSSELAEPPSSRSRDVAPSALLADLGGVSGADAQSAELRHQLQLAQGELQARRSEIQALRSSTSWRITGPVRRAVTMFRPGRR